MIGHHNAVTEEAANGGSVRADYRLVHVQRFQQRQYTASELAAAIAYMESVWGDYDAERQRHFLRAIRTMWRALLEERRIIAGSVTDWFYRQDTGPYAVHSIGEAGVPRTEFSGFHYPGTALDKVAELEALHAGHRVIFIAVNTDDPEESVERAAEAFAVPYAEEWECPYCGQRPKGYLDPSVISCCKEVGHATPVCPTCDSGCTTYLRERIWKCSECHDVLEVA